MLDWFKGLFKSSDYQNLQAIVNNSEKINADLDKLSQNYPTESEDIRSLYQNLNNKLTSIFSQMDKNKNSNETQPPQPTQMGGRRTKKLKHQKKSKHSKKSRQTRK
jgi:hypothetical protein